MHKIQKVEENTTPNINHSKPQSQLVWREGGKYIKFPNKNAIETFLGLISSPWAHVFF